MTTYIKTTSHVYHIEVDISDPEILLFSDLSSLKTTDGNQTLLVVGSDIESGYIEAAGLAARFNKITGFTQISPTIIVIADYENNCLRVVEWTSLSTLTLAGVCKTYGNRDGSDARFSGPWSVMRHPKSASQILVTDYKNSAVRQVDLVTRITRTLISRGSGLERPAGIMADPSGNHLLIVNRQHISRYDFQSQNLSKVVSHTTSGNSDKNHFYQALFNDPIELARLSDDVMLIADLLNDRVAVVSTEENFVSSICTANWTTRDGPVKKCGLSYPWSLLVTDKEIYVGENGAIRSVTCE